MTAVQGRYQARAAVAAAPPLEAFVIEDRAETTTTAATAR
jgi:hypothetical protein